MEIERTDKKGKTPGRKAGEQGGWGLSREKMQEGVDLKKFLLLFIHRLWLILAAAAAGAVAGAGVYYLAAVTFAPERDYQAVSKFYLDFAYDEKGNRYDYYNGYTWNELIKASPILDTTMQNLPSDIGEETVAAATKAEIISDIRLLTVTVTAKTPELAAQIQKATQSSLLELGRTGKEFEQITVIDEEEPFQEVPRSRMKAAAATGMTAAVVLMLLGLSAFYVLSDSFYVERDVERRLGLTVMGTFIRENPDGYQPWEREFQANFAYLCGGKKQLCLLGPDGPEEAERTGRMLARALSSGSLPAECELIPMESPQESPELYERIRRTDGAILIVRYGRGGGKRAEHLLDQLRRQDCQAAGAVLVETDDAFFERYYGTRRKTQRPRTVDRREGKAGRQPEAGTENRAEDRTEG